MRLLKIVFVCFIIFLEFSFCNYENNLVGCLGFVIGFFIIELSVMFSWLNLFFILCCRLIEIVLLFRYVILIFCFVRDFFSVMVGRRCLGVGMVSINIWGLGCGIGCFFFGGILIVIILFCLECFGNYKFCFNFYK